MTPMIQEPEYAVSFGWALPLATIAVFAIFLLGCSQPAGPVVEPPPTEPPGGPNSCEYANDGECDEGTYCPIGTDQNDCSVDPPPQTGVSVSLSDMTPYPSQGQLVVIDYEGPEFDEDDLRITVGNDSVDGLFLDDQISLLLPLSHEGRTTLGFDFGEGKSASLVLNISPAPAIADPRQYVSDEIAGLATSFARLVASDSAFQGAYDALVEVQLGLTDLDEQEVNELAIFIKQNIEPSLASGPDTANRTLAPAFTEDPECQGALVRFARSILVVSAGVTVVALAPSTGPLAVPGLVVGAIAVVRGGQAARISYSEAYDECTQIVLEGIGFGEGNRRLLRTQASSLPTLRFDDGQSMDLTVSLTRTVFSEYRTRLLDNVAKMRFLMLRVKRIVGKVTTRFDASFDALLEQFPETIERTEPADANGFTLKGISDRNIAGEIVGASGTTLSVRFTFVDSSSVSADYVDFGFILANDELRLDDTSVGARLYRATGPSFGDRTVSSQGYEERVEIAPLPLPEATGGRPPLTYSLTPSVPGLTFNPDEDGRSLTGTPTRAGTYDMRYEVRDANGSTATLLFTITIDSGPTEKLIEDRSYEIATPVSDTLPALFADVESSFLCRASTRYTGGYPSKYECANWPHSILEGLRFDDSDLTINGIPGEIVSNVTILYWGVSYDESAFATFEINVTGNLKPISLSECLAGDGERRASIEFDEGVIRCSPQEERVFLYLETERKIALHIFDDTHRYIDSIYPGVSHNNVRYAGDGFYFSSPCGGVGSNCWEPTPCWNSVRGCSD